MSKYTITYLQQYLIDVLNIQLFITLISLPILISWGIPFALFSVIGNIVFSPFLTIYILLSSLIFLGTLFGITCFPLLWLLDKLSILWLTMLNSFPKTALIGFAKPPTVFLCALIIVTLGILHTKSLSKSTKSLLYLLLIIGTTVCSEVNKRSQKSIIEIPCFNGSVYLLTSNNTTILIDPGAMGQRMSAPSWAEYTLLPTILKKTGRTYIDHIIILQPTIFTFKALESLCRKAAIKNAYIPMWYGENQHKWRGPFINFKQIATTHNCSIIRFGNSQKLPISIDNFISLKTFGRTDIAKNGICFSNAQVVGLIDNKSFNFYASSCMKHKETIHIP